MLVNSETATRPVRGMPFTRFLGDLNRKKLMLISTSGVAPRLTGFHEPQNRFFMIPDDVRASDLYLSRRHTGLEEMESDLNCVFPIERLREIAASGLIQSTTTKHISVNETHLVTLSVRSSIAPRIAELVEAEDAGGAIVLGVGVLGHRISAIVQKAVEDRGIPTVTISQYPRLSRFYNVSRIVHPVGFLPGHLVGPPDWPELQRQVLQDAIEFLVAAREPLSLLEKDYPDYPVQPPKRRFQLLDHSANWLRRNAV